jgi:glycosyltransferase involved in cell wall biosynthesis
LSKAVAGLVVLKPLQSFQEALPVKMFEYMAAGLPVIASDFPLWRTIIDGEKCGILVDPLDPQALASTMSWILEHPAEAAEMGKRGRAAVRERYNWESEARALLGFYDALSPRNSETRPSAA